MYMEDIFYKSNFTPENKSTFTVRKIDELGIYVLLFFERTLQSLLSDEFMKKVSQKN
jgi:hypothetical protein